MIKGIYNAASGMLTTAKQMDIISNNLANADTDGYKREDGIQESFPEMLVKKLERGKNPDNIGSLGTGTRLEESYTDFASGNFKYTGNDLDLALKDEGFFVVETPQGRRYTRNGDFALNDRGQIVSGQGFPVVSTDNTPLQIEAGSSIRFDGSGYLHSEDIEELQLQVVDFADKSQLQKFGENLYQINPEAEDVEEEIVENYQILPGYLEASNVNVVEEMSKMIAVNRLYEANQKVISSIDESLGKAVNEVGRVG